MTIEVPPRNNTLRLSQRFSKQNQKARVALFQPLTVNEALAKRLAVNLVRRRAAFRDQQVARDSADESVDQMSNKLGKPNGHVTPLMRQTDLAASRHSWLPLRARAGRP